MKLFPMKRKYPKVGREAVIYLCQNFFFPPSLPFLEKPTLKADMTDLSHRWYLLFLLIVLPFSFIAVW